MKYSEKFEDEGFVYELSVRPTLTDEGDLHVFSQGSGYLCEWTITAKQNYTINEVVVTDDRCDAIVYNTVEAAIKGAKEFLAL
jgi:hypothetical protein